MNIVRTALPLTLLALALAACAPPGPLGIPSGPPTVSGSVVSIRHSATASGLLVEPGDGACGLQATADAETRYYRRSASGRLTPLGAGAAGVGALAVGDAVSVYAGGPVAESCPMEGRAAVVVVQTPAVDPALLAGHWVHAVEEDADGVEVYRLEGSREFPPRMFRQQYVLREGGQARGLVVHPADAHYFESGTWAFAPDRPDVVRITYGERVDVLRVLDLRPGLLRVVRIEV